MPHKIPRNPSIYSFASFLIVSLTAFTNKKDSSSDLTIFIMVSTKLRNEAKRVKTTQNNAYTDPKQSKKPKLPTRRLSPKE